MGEKETASARQGNVTVPKQTQGATFGERTAGGGEDLAIDEEGLQRTTTPPDEGPEALKAHHDTAKNSIQNIR